MLPLLLALVASAPQPPDTVVVCPAVMRQALEPWVRYRTEQGHRVVVVPGAPTAEEVRESIRRAAGKAARFVVLVGDADPEAYFDGQIASRSLPVHWAEAKATAAFAPEWHIAADNWYADLDDDKSPDVAIGRLTADTPQELSQIIEKTIAYERSSDFGTWRRRLNLVAGVGGFGLLTDTMLESAARYYLTERIPSACDVSMTYASWRSPYCPDPRRFREITLQRLSEGSLFWVYLGHGFHVELDRLNFGGAEYPILSTPDVAQIRSAAGSPIAMFLACYTGALDAREDCLAEEMLRTPGAPVAVLAASRVTMPYGLSVWGLEMADAVFQSRAATLGEAVLRAKQRMLAAPDARSGGRGMLDTLATVLSPTGSKLAEEREDHVLLFNLFGDPLLRLRHPTPVTMDVASKTTPGAVIEVRGTSPLAGQAKVELVLRRDRLGFAPVLRAQCPQPEDWDELQAAYERTSNSCLAAAELEVTPGPFSARLRVPEDASGPCHVRVFISGAAEFAQGAADVSIGPTGDAPPPAAPHVAEKPAAAGARR